MDLSVWTAQAAMAWYSLTYLVTTRLYHQICCMEHWVCVRGGRLSSEKKVCLVTLWSNLSFPVWLYPSKNEHDPPVLCRESHTWCAHGWSAADNTAWDWHRTRQTHYQLVSATWTNQETSSHPGGMCMTNRQIEEYFHWSFQVGKCESSAYRATFVCLCSFVCHKALQRVTAAGMAARHYFFIPRTALLC